jgi:hypothetical protein
MTAPSVRPALGACFTRRAGAKDGDIPPSASLTAARNSRSAVIFQGRSGLARRPAEVHRCSAGARHTRAAEPVWPGRQHLLNFLRVNLPGFRRQHQGGLLEQFVPTAGWVLTRDQDNGLGQRPHFCAWWPVTGGAKGTRTPGLLDANQTLFQLSYSPMYLQTSVPAPRGEPGGKRIWPNGAQLAALLEQAGQAAICQRLAARLAGRTVLQSRVGE